MRNKYASREIDGMLRAWKVKGDVGVERANREAEKSSFQIGGRSLVEAVWEIEGVFEGMPSFVTAI